MADSKVKHISCSVDGFINYSIEFRCRIKGVKLTTTSLGIIRNQKKKKKQGALQEKTHTGGNQSKLNYRSNLNQI